MGRTKKTKSIDAVQKSKDKEETLTLPDADEFVVHHIDEEEEGTLHVEHETISSAPPSFEKTIEPISMPVTPSNESPKTVKVSFANFVQLVANHNYEEVIKENADEDVIVNSDLLTELANAHEQEEERRIPAIFIIGVILGIIVTYILLTY